MITFVKLVCPACGANLEVDAKLSQCFCQYCGTKILLHNENEHIERFVNEAEVARQENERRKIEFEQKKYEDKRSEAQKNSVSNGVALLSVLLIFPTAYMAIGGIICIMTGGFLRFLIGLLLFGCIALAWYGRSIIAGKVALSKTIGILCMSSAGVLALLCAKWMVDLGTFG